MSSIYRKDDFFYTLESKIGMKRMEGIGEMSGFLYPKERCFFCVNCASFFSLDTMHKIDSKKRQKVLTIDKFQYFFFCNFRMANFSILFHFYRQKTNIRGSNKKKLVRYINVISISRIIFCHILAQILFTMHVSLWYKDSNHKRTHCNKHKRSRHTQPTI